MWGVKHFKPDNVAVFVWEVMSNEIVKSIHEDQPISFTLALMNSYFKESKRKFSEILKYFKTQTLEQ